MPVSGTLRQIRTFPVKSMDGAPVDEAEIGPEGLRGDRGWAVVDASGQPLRAKDHPALHAVLAREREGGLELQLPGRAPLTARDAVRHLGPLLGAPAPLALAEQPGGARQVAAVHVVTVQELGRAPGCAPGSGPVEDPRANLLLDLPGAPPPQAWCGARLRIGDVELRVERLPRHCAGLYASVVRPGRVRRGDEVLLEPVPELPGS